MPSYAEVASINGSSSPDSNSGMQKKDFEIVGRAIDQYPVGKSYSTSLEEVPVTFERKPHIPKDEDALRDPSTARATIAASKESPNGTTQNNWVKEHQNQTVVQQHASYWDFDNDGIIWPQDTYRGCRMWGWNPPLSFLTATSIHLGLSYLTCPSFLPDPCFRLWVSRLHKAKHGSNSMSYDNEGRFRPQNFEDFFAKYDVGNKGGLDIHDLLRAWKGQRLLLDFFGTTAAFFEWLTVYLLLWPEDGVMRKDEVRRVFDGSIFLHKAEEYKRKQQLKQENR